MQRRCMIEDASNLYLYPFSPSCKGSAVAADKSFTEASQVLSSNDGDDVALLKCLMPAVPPTEGAACTINGRRGRLYAETGFVAQQQVGGGDGVAVAELPFGEELGSYAVGHGSEGEKDTEVRRTDGRRL